MQIKIKNIDLCETCSNRTCAFIDARIKEQFYSIRTETTVCPLAILIDETKPTSFGDKCIKCALCVESCFVNNLEIVDDNEQFKIANLSELQYNAIALGYLDKITGFAANTNRNRSLNFDGFLQTRKGESCFVEVDYNNDSLECCRRLIGAFITYEGLIGPIRNGLIVLNEFPKEGSRDVLNVIDKLMAFPTTKDCKIYFCTFSLLRHMMLKVNTSNQTLSELFYNPREESVDRYLHRIINEDILQQKTDLDLSLESTDSNKYGIYDDVAESEKFVDFLPLYSFKAACGQFGSEELVEPIGWIKVEGLGRLNSDMFVVQAKGNSMEPQIHDGDHCVFTKYQGGSRKGEIVLCEHRNFYDEDNAGAYSIKQYFSEKETDEDGLQIGTKVTLKPFNNDYNPIVIDAENDDTNEFRVVAIYRGKV